MDHSIIRLCGKPGVGKTSFLQAFQTAHPDMLRIVSEYPDIEGQDPMAVAESLFEGVSVVALDNAEVGMPSGKALLLALSKVAKRDGKSVVVVSTLRPALEKSTLCPAVETVVAAELEEPIEGWDDAFIIKMEAPGKATLLEKGKVGYIGMPEKYLLLLADQCGAQPIENDPDHLIVDADVLAQIVNKAQAFERLKLAQQFPVWQPISTAPKDGTEVLALVGGRMPWVTVSYDRLENRFINVMIPEQRIYEDTTIWMFGPALP